ncbi:DUF2892 domain-containing protein [Pontibacter mangrovi]|uniref:DUF2892 domain-containing protein n=1 Tax=Pontibacter mangrovi TaxID=2589816 RepID=A0A501W4I7_9BACT|nr:DUF2892 domain-containing protein [Pontibacter mangrovi]TPE43565.1 DUF2892 domain-containing protein [Pontibacter mangrovi]
MKEKNEGRVRQNTSEAVNKGIDAQTLQNIDHYGHNGPEQIAARLESLNKEWDVERMLEIHGSALTLAGLLLGAKKDKRWLLLAGIGAGFVLQHGLQGWCPSLPIYRRLGFRTRAEIDEERYALKALRGDFNRVLGATTAEGVMNVVRS